MTVRAAQHQVCTGQARECVPSLGEAHLVERSPSLLVERKVGGQADQETTIRQVDLGSTLGSLVDQGSRDIFGHRA